MCPHWALPRGHLRAYYPGANTGQSFYSSGVLIERSPRHRSAPNRPSAVSLRLLRFLLGAQYAPLSCTSRTIGHRVDDRSKNHAMTVLVPGYYARSSRNIDTPLLRP
jgi:hypothetical protein